MSNALNLKLFTFCGELNIPLALRGVGVPRLSDVSLSIRDGDRENKYKSICVDPYKFQCFQQLLDTNFVVFVIILVVTFYGV